MLTETPALDDAPVVVTIPRDRLLRGVLLGALAVELALFLADATLNHAGWLASRPLQRLFNATREDALPSWFGVTQTFCTGLVALWAAAVERGRGRPAGTVFGWALVGACFVYLALDDGSGLHERLGTWFDERADDGVASWFPSYGWQVLFAPVFGGMGLYLLAFLGRELGDTTSRLGVLVAMATMGGAIVLDFLEGLPKADPANPYAALGRVPAVDALAHRAFAEDGYAMVLHFSKSIEECVEMAAMTVMLWVLLRTVTAKAPEQRWTFG